MRDKLADSRLCSKCRELRCRTHSALWKDRQNSDSQRCSFRTGSDSDQNEDGHRRPSQRGAIPVARATASALVRTAPGSLSIGPEVAATLEVTLSPYPKAAPENC